MSERVANRKYGAKLLFVVYSFWHAQSLECFISWFHVRRNIIRWHCAIHLFLEKLWFPLFIDDGLFNSRRYHPLWIFIFIFIFIKLFGFFAVVLFLFYIIWFIFLWRCFFVFPRSYFISILMNNERFTHIIQHAIENVIYEKGSSTTWKINFLL